MQSDSVPQKTYREIIARRSLDPQLAASFIGAVRSRENLLMEWHARRICGDPTGARSIGGKARAASMSPEVRSEQSRKAANARWHRGDE
jgi:hypothetical protein